MYRFARMPHKNLHNRRHTRGTALVMALVFLLAATLIALSASGRSILQQRMTHGLYQAEMADMLAETTLRGAEWSLWMQSIDPLTPLHCGMTSSSRCYRYDLQQPIYQPGGVVSTFRSSNAWVENGASVYRGPANTIDYTIPRYGGAAHNPVFIVEDLGIERPPGMTSGPSESGATGGDRSGYDSHERHIYRITARASGPDRNILRVVESTYAAKSH
ncbi:hypothetical protein [Dyella sp.]|uniref:pilus assembly PilX family protein n=1 Tax=Dyella sp. TaxID=1869338 RepID=UPI002ED4E1BC